MILPLVQIKKYGGKVLADTNGRQALRLVLMEKNVRYVPVARVIAGINDLATLEPLLAKQWSKKNKIKPTEVSIGSHKKVIWRCEKGHEWEAAVKSRTINRTGCPYCSHNKVLGGFNDLATLLPDIAAEWSDRNYPTLPTQVTVFANRKAWWKCKDCGREWNTLISTRSGGSKCPYCSGYIFLKGFNDLQTTHPEIASEWSEKNLSLKGLQGYTRVSLAIKKIPDNEVVR